MAFCPFANQQYRGKSPGPYKGGPFKIVVHTTEGSTAAGAIATYRKRGIYPHFTTDADTIYQHIDTGVSASAVLNRRGGVETNRLSAVQIEMVGFAGQAKNPAMLGNTARLCRWLEVTHGIPRRWPAGRPRGQAGPHNRSARLWTTEGGYYGHSQCPENEHYDPGYLSDAELAILMGAGEAGPLRINGTDQSEVFTRGEDWKIEGGATWIKWSTYAGWVGYYPAEYDPATDSPNLITKKIDGPPDT